MKAKFKVPRVRKAKTPANSLTKLQKKEVKILAGQDLQKKYVDTPSYTLATSVTTALIDQYGVLPYISSGGAGTSAWSVIPKLQQGVQQHQRISNEIENVKIHFRAQFWLNAGGDVPLLDTADYYVKMFIVKPKVSRDQALAATITPGTFLTQGDGTTADWRSTGVNQMSQDLLPVFKESWTVLKTHRFRLTKNQDGQQGGNGDGAAPNLISHQFKRIDYTYSHPGKLRYQMPGTTGDNDLPTNLSILCFAVIYQPQNVLFNAASFPILANARTAMTFTNV